MVVVVGLGDKTEVVIELRGARLRSVAGGELLIKGNMLEF